ncbi:hypothetical protein LRX75_06865 [Rhizobium sp. DKSPLA3]|uniref:Uncharacterized protein n=1 Tax=Rhizobium quercicola TaxID=2901226 RepID=A0A9X1SZT7_9HYPH|nr:hypothetical protein [Rhizobium quercicola]MCD7108761.1 hypothetical protein [Rhizobium quercicola]
MRISSFEYDRGYAAVEAARQTGFTFDVTLNGAPVAAAVMADEEEGTVEFCRLNEAGEIYLTAEEHAYVNTAYGAVVVTKRAAA